MMTNTSRKRLNHVQNRYSATVKEESGRSEQDHLFQSLEMRYEALVNYQQDRVIEEVHDSS